MERYKFYKITNNVNSKYYYGVAKMSNKGYFGGGTLIRKAVSKYGRENFTMTTIMEFDNADDAFEHESNVVTIDLVNDPMCYNVALGGSNGRFVRTEEFRRRMSEAQPDQSGENNARYGITPDNARFFLDQDSGVYMIGLQDVADHTDKAIGTIHSWFTTHKHRNKTNIIEV